MSEKIQSHRELKVWQSGIDFVVRIYTVVKEFPKIEMYGLSDQLRRAAYSVPSNIAEGHARTTKEYLHFVSIAIGSLAEIDTHLEVAKRLNYSQPNQLDELAKNGIQLTRMLYSLRNALRGKLNRDNL
jgi:four helix bundle protein